MPIVDLARRLEDAGVAALTIHCRVAQVGHSGPADWSWARRAREVVSIPVIVNGDVKSADDAVRALAETGCAGVMVGRAAIDDPWVLREARALIERGERLPRPTAAERVALYAELLRANVEVRGPRYGVEVTRRHLGLLGPELRVSMRAPVVRARTEADVLEVLARVTHDACSSGQASASVS